MNTCPCIESVKTLVTTGKWYGVSCECGKKVPLSHLIIAGVVGLVLTPCWARCSCVGQGIDFCVP